MPFDLQRARPLLHNGDLPKLFVEELGWEPCRRTLTLRAGETDYTFTAVAEKRAFTAWLCACTDGSLPDHTTRLKLDRALAQTSFEHLVVFTTVDLGRQSWVWVRRQPGRPLSAKTHDFTRGQPGDSLLAKLQILYVSFEEEEAGLSITQMAGRARAAFDIERVTKAFYRDFDTHRKAFVKFIDGIGEVADREWYASVMLNRLMFVYFIQRKGFLDGDPHYLRDRLKRCQQDQGKDKFYTFYRYFLLRLFHEGFGKRRKDRAPDLEKLLGNIPYLNGGLFDVHELEKPDRYGKDIQIPDKAFERVFDYFDHYQWHLDERPLRADNEINPDVLGYIFEKYINQKQMGAYYTKEDITEYISKSTVIPFLFDAASAKCKIAFDSPPSTLNSQPTVWDLLRETPDRYIYPAVRHGADKKLPPEIAAGLAAKKPDLVQRRKAWNTPAPSDYALSSEIWREVVARRQRCEELRNKLTTGEVRDINDFVTLNLDLRQFAQDVIENCEGPDLLMAFWQAITNITILDPTGGSGAFIFAALNILEPLYEACLDRMEAFLSEWGENGSKFHPNYHRKFTEVLARVAAHPNHRYFVLKSIILNNLYAVDIMKEAVEICKLRLFLKLAAQVEPDAAKDNLGIEPLPDIDFNVRAGNTLVGYANAEEVRRCMKVEKTTGADQMRLGVIGEKDAYAEFEDEMLKVDAAFRSFRQQQTEMGGTVTAEDKRELQKRLVALETKLNGYLARDYGVKTTDKPAYSRWLATHQPFHWLIEFYGILSHGGFDVIIGNPPYVEITKVSSQYRLRNFATESCGNLYAPCTERSFTILHQNSRFGFIVQQPITSTVRMAPVRQLILQGSSSAWSATFDDRPSKLFDGMHHARLAIILSQRKRDGASLARLSVTPYNKWFKDERTSLFQRLHYVAVTLDLMPAVYPKISADTEIRIARNLATQAGKLGNWLSGTGTRHKLFYKITGVGSWFTITPRPPRFLRNGQESSSTRESEMAFASAEARDRAFCVLNSSLFYWFYQVRTNCRDFNPSDFKTFPVPRSIDAEDMSDRAKALWQSLEDSAGTVAASHSLTGEIAYEQFRPRVAKPIIDQIDIALARHYGFTPEELDFILNYDIKYRLGRDAEEENE